MLVQFNPLPLVSKDLVVLLFAPKAKALSNGNLKMIKVEFTCLFFTMLFTSLNPHFVSFAPNIGLSKQMIITFTTMKPAADVY